MSDQPAVKPSYLSKTLWINFVLAACALFVPAGEAWVQAHPEGVALVFTVVNVALRFLTKDRLALY